MLAFEKAAEAGAEIYTAGISETDTSALGVDTVGFDGEEPYIVEDLDAYETMEILTMDQEGTVSIYSCDSKEEVGRKIGELSQEEGISVIQPNYRYEDQALAVNDASSGEQWALQNDGSFQMDERTIYPIYANPFGRPLKRSAVNCRKLIKTMPKKRKLKLRKTKKYKKASNFPFRRRLWTADESFSIKER